LDLRRDLAGAADRRRRRQGRARARGTAARRRRRRRGADVVSRDPQSRQASRVVVGLFIIAIGVFALLDNLNLFDNHLVQPFWPLVFVALGAMRIARWPGDGPRLVFSVGLIGVGAAMTLNNLGYIHFHVRDWWPALVVL